MHKMVTKKNQAIFSLIAFTFLFAFSLALVSGAVVSPATSATVSGTIVLNATNASLPDMVNCTWTAGSSLTANTSASLGTFTNESANPLNINGTFDTTTLEDANDYTFTAVCTNSTSSQTTSTSTGVIIDNTVPQTPSSLTPASNPSSPQTTSTTQTFSSTVTGANTTSCTYVIARGGASSGSDYITGTGTHTGNTCSFTKAFTSTTDNGNWKWSIVASDETNSSASSATNDFNVQLTASNGGLPGGDDSSGGSGDTEPSSALWWILAIIAIIIVLAVIFWMK